MSLEQLIDDIMTVQQTPQWATPDSMDSLDGMDSMSSDAEPADRAIPRLDLPNSHRGVCICQNLAMVAVAFARLTDDELFAVPRRTRERARDTLLGVWRILDLLQEIEDTRDEAQPTMPVERCDSLPSGDMPDRGQFMSIPWNYDS